MKNLPKILVLDIDGVLTDGTVGTGRDPSRRIQLRDLDALARARVAGIQVAFLTGERAEAMTELVMRCGGGVAIYGAKDKEAGLRRLAEALDVEVGDLCYVADARRDTAALKIAGLGLVPSDGDPEARHTADRVLAHSGGQGAVAEVVDLLLVGPPAVQAQPVPSVIVTEGVAEAMELMRRFASECLPEVECLAQLLSGTLESGGKVLLFGNGGSAAMAQHAATELVCRYRLDRAPLPAIALCSDTSLVTAAANDWSFEEVFRRQVNAHGQPGDLAVALSTSGTSRNVIRGLEAATTRGLKTALMTGCNPDPFVARSCDACLRVPSDNVARIQELHLLAWHIVCEVVEARMNDGYGRSGGNAGPAEARQPEVST